ncbi:hypothetical protein BRAS3843_2030008 [Bradyrhizobium sp. STM 3843]|nr:hypothetical protein BRAS3843_2030008 [Bradyrhizobium sp. STM 3843]
MKGYGQQESAGAKLRRFRMGQAALQPPAGASQPIRIKVRLVSDAAAARRGVSAALGQLREGVAAEGVSDSDGSRKTQIERETTARAIARARRPISNSHKVYYGIYLFIERTEA